MPLSSTHWALFSFPITTTIHLFINPPLKIKGVQVPSIFPHLVVVLDVLKILERWLKCSLVEPVLYCSGKWITGQRPLYHITCLSPNYDSSCHTFRNLSVLIITRFLLPHVAGQTTNLVHLGEKAHGQRTLN